MVLSTVPYSKLRTVLKSPCIIQYRIILTHSQNKVKEILAPTEFKFYALFLELCGNS